MKYSFYQVFNKDDNSFKLIVQTPMKIIGYQFFSDIKHISNELGMTRLFGKQIDDSDARYALFPINKDVQVGNFDLIEENENFMKLSFDERGIGDLKGEWILRKLNNGETLFWKPFSTITQEFSQEVTIDNKQKSKEVTQSYSVFEIHSNEHEFSGIVAAQGIWTGRDKHTTLFTKELIQMLASDMKQNREIQLVDFNHNLINSGKITSVELKEERGISHISITGVADRPVPAGSGLSIMIKSTIKWDRNLNIYVPVSAESKGVSILTENNPACTICMVR